jgi:RNA polymerase sigma-70 factor, ECF subfamily
MDPSDESLMERYARGDGAAFQVLFQRYRRPVFEFFRRRTRSPERAADLSQELFLRVHSARATFRSDGVFQPWFFRIARHLCIDDLRRVERGLDGGPPSENLAARGSHDAESQLAMRQSINVLLESLPPEQARILYASKGLGARYEEVAEAIGKSVEAVKQAASRALRRLRSAPQSLDV